ncbi:MAG TPA: hypothetical protein PKZ84_21305 [Anaerolineae bacterium]|nr:hypothetical protein [Anaerolineae bacterium]HQI87174.1 hypothetical protein [Anaerolineae bacterium]
MKIERHQLVGVLLTSMGSLALEVTLTRIFSVTMWYHFAFLAISLAMMGSAMAGVVLYFFPKITAPEQARRWIGWAALALAVSVPMTFWLYLKMPFHVAMNREGGFSVQQFLVLVLIYLDLTIPFFLNGVVMALALSGWAAQAGRIYWADLTGAALGCLFSILTLDALGGAGALLALSVVTALAGVAFSAGWFPRKPAQALPLVGFLLMAALLVSNVVHPWLQIRVNKAGGEEAPLLYEKWNAHSRVTVYEPNYYPFFWSVAHKYWEKAVNESATYGYALLLIDSVAGTPIQNFNGDMKQVDFLRYDLTSFVYHLIERPETLVIGPGGGRDVLAALATDAPHVTAVEVNPAVIDAVRGPMRDFAGDIYGRPDVSVVIADARGYIDRSPARYDVIQASLIDTWAAGGSGAFALSENSLYTREAFKTYYEHLSDRGILTVSRWYLPERPAETMRLVATGMAGWEAAGVTDPRQHVVVVVRYVSGATTEGLSTALFKREPFTEAEVAALLQKAADLEFTVIYAPGLQPTEEVGALITAPDRAAFIADYPLDISPATDDRPFFFNLVLLGDLLDPALSGSGVYRTSMEAILILFAVIGVSVLFGGVFVIVPLLVGTRKRKLPRPPARILGYFGALGIAFMLLEIPIIQKLTVYLGRPVYSLAVVLFTLLLCSGLGSLWSSRWPAETIARRVRQIFPILLAVIAGYIILNQGILRLTLGLPLGIRIAVAVLMLAALGFFMGIPFPVGMRWSGTRWPGVVPWLWGVNGVTSVLGSALATALAIHVGFRVTLLCAAVVYALAGLLFTKELAAPENSPIR